MMMVGPVLAAGCAREPKRVVPEAGVGQAVARVEEPPERDAGKALFEHEWQAPDPLASGDGLGPVFNARSCSACHFQGGVGGSGSLAHNVLSFEAHPTPREPLVRSGMIHAFAIDPSDQENEQVLRQRFPPVSSGTRVEDGGTEEAADFDPLHLAGVNTPALFGAGWIERIPARALTDNRTRRLLAQSAREQEQKFDTVPIGRLRLLADGRVGKLGWKAQVATLPEFVALACASELGLGNPLRAQDRPLGHSDYPPVKPDLTEKQFAALVSFVATLPRPVETLPADARDRARAVRGKELFGSVGCAICHTPNLGGVQGIYSDFLLYTLEPPGTPEGAAYPQGTAQDLPPGLPPLPEGHPRPEEWKTPPLWGVADSAPYFHDGKSPTLHGAILRHGGDAAGVRGAYQRLAAEDQEAVIAFLRTLRAPRPGAQPERASEPGGVDQDGILAEIRRLGGTAEVDENRPGKPVVRLNLSGTRVTDTELAPLGALPQLQALDLSQTQITNAGLAALRGLPNLQELDLGINTITDAGLAHLEELTQLQALSVRFTLLTDAGLAHLERLTQLRMLRLDGTAVTDRGIEHLARLAQLRELDLSSTKVGDAGLRCLEGLTELQVLGLRSTAVEDAGLKRLKGLVHLRKLDLDGRMVTDSGLAYLRNLAELEELNISRTQVTDAGLKHLQGLTRLRLLRLDNTRVSDAGLVYLRSLARLRTLTLAGTEITDAGLAHLRELTQLQELDLHRTKVSGTGCKSLQQAMPNAALLR
jgi:CxxC motif-containing protein (DUF1111 family)/Leucine-rich repeat (LRR) protein